MFGFKPDKALNLSNTSLTTFVDLESPWHSTNKLQLLLKDEIHKRDMQGLCLLLDSPAALLLHWPLTIYQAIQLASAKQLIPETMDELCIHYLGPERELHQLAVFGELHALLPGVQLYIVFVGPSVPYDRDGETIALCSYAHCMEVNCSCKSGKGEFGLDITADKPSVITIRLHSGYYHDRYEELTKEFVPDLIIAPNAGIAAYRSCLQKLDQAKITREEDHLDQPEITT